MKNNFLIAFILIVLTIPCLAQEEIKKLNERSYYYLGVNPDSACFLAKQLRDMGLQNYPKERAMNQLVLGCCFRYDFKMDSALQEFYLARDYFEVAGMKKELANAHWYIGKVWNEVNSYAKAIAQYKIAVDLYGEINDFKTQHRVLLEMGTVDVKKGNLSAALNQFIQSHEIALIYDSANAGRALINAISIYTKTGDYTKALELSNDAITSIKKQPIYKKIAFELFLLKGIAFRNLNQIDSASFYYKKAEEEAKNKKHIIRAEYYTGILHKRFGNHKKAISIFKKLLEEDKLKFHPYNLHLTEIYLIKKQLDSALFYANQGYLYSVERHMKGEVVRASEKLVEAYELKGDLQKANFFLKEVINYKDSIFTGREQRLLTDSKVQLETSDKSHQIEILKSTIEIEDVKRRNLTITMVLLIFFFIAAVLVIILRSNFRSKIQKLENIQVKKEIEAKKRDLSSQTMKMIQMTNGFTSIKDKLAEIQKDANGQTKKVRELANAIKMLEVSNKEWSIFQEYFDDLHQNSTANLDKFFPDLTITDRRLVALIKLDMNNSEISSLLSIETKSVRMAKYRLKKKLQLNEADDLRAFVKSLDEIHKNEFQKARHIPRKKEDFLKKNWPTKTF